MCNVYIVDWATHSFVPSHTLSVTLCGEREKKKKKETRKKKGLIWEQKTEKTST